ncbi:class I SAM-dependent methyltransferase [Rossellomorea vietnamensis]|uniref:Class I SAM-dependent methyltransferase n=1 Tax=Rossellomorea vietnamensis TaxID=218284 RepID=A0A5D4NYS8_9BACI|nr:class I SAM-dependent methyltransferase [Rossellomorea vietnamensis]
MIEEETFSVLDLGAGPGKDSLFFQENGIHPFAVDISPEMISLCREKGVQAEVLNCDEVNKLGRKFEAAWAINSLLHILKKDIEAVLRTGQERSFLSEGIIRKEYGKMIFMNQSGSSRSILQQLSSSLLPYILQSKTL